MKETILAFEDKYGILKLVATEQPDAEELIKPLFSYLQNMLRKLPTRS